MLDGEFLIVDRYQREEPFTTLNVDIRNHQNLLESLEQYVKGDLLEAANAYHCEKCNKKVYCFLISVHVVGCWGKREVNVTIFRSILEVDVTIFRPILDVTLIYTCIVHVHYIFAWVYHDLKHIQSSSDYDL